MSSSAVSCCTYSPEVSFASATSASSPTDGGLLSCPSAFKYSAPYHNPRQNQQHPPPSHPALFVAVPNAAGQWSSFRPSPPLRSSSVLLLRSSVPHETNFQKTANHDPSFGSIRPRTPCPRKKFLSPTQNLFQPRSSSTSITVCEPFCSSPTQHTGPSPTSSHPSTLLKTHSHRARSHRGAASFKSLYQKRPPQNPDEATNFSSAVASDTTLGLR